MSAEALARVLCAMEGVKPDARVTPGGKRQWHLRRDQADLILADPGPLLAALAEAGVLTEERTAPFVSEAGDTWHIGFGHAPSRVPLGRYVTDWTETP